MFHGVGIEWVHAFQRDFWQTVEQSTENTQTCIPGVLSWEAMSTPLWAEVDRRC